MKNLWRYDFMKPKSPWAVPPAAPASGPEAAPQVKSLADLSADELRAIAKERGVKVHHKAGKVKLLAALEGGSA